MTTEHPSPTPPALDTEQQIRLEALRAAAHWHLGHTTLDQRDPHDVVAAARTFENYLRGDR